MKHYDHWKMNGEPRKVIPIDYTGSEAVNNDWELAREVPKQRKRKLIEEELKT